MTHPEEVFSSSEFLSNAQGTPLPSLAAMYGNQDLGHNREFSGTNVRKEDTTEV